MSLKKYTLFIILGFLALQVFAQTAAENWSDGQNARRTHIAWEPVPNAVNYEVNIEAQNEGWLPVMTQRSAGEIFVDCMLPPGNYRYRVRAYNIAGVSGEPSEWVNFAVNSFSGGAAAKAAIRNGDVWEFGFSLNYLPAFVLPGSDFENYLDNSPIGGEFDFYAIPPWANYASVLGFGLSIWTNYTSGKPSGIFVESFLGGIHANLFYRLLLGHFALKLKGGFGISQWFGYNEAFSPPGSVKPNTDDATSADIDFSLSYFITRSFFIEAGVNAYIRFSRQPNGGLGLLRPHAGLGLSFGG